MEHIKLDILHNYYLSLKGIYYNIMKFKFIGYQKTKNRKCRASDNPKVNLKAPD